MVQDGHVLPQNDPLIWGNFDSKIGLEKAHDQRRAEYPRGRAERRVKLDGNVVRRKADGKAQDIWDSELPGFCLRVLASGRKMWCVFVRERGKLRRVTLGDARVIRAKAARMLAKARLAEAALDVQRKHGAKVTQVVNPAPKIPASTGPKGSGARKAARKPTCCVTKINGPGVVSAKPNASAISPARSQPKPVTASCAI